MNKDLFYYYTFNKIPEFFGDITNYIENGSMSVTHNTNKNNKFTNHSFSVVTTASFMAKVLVHS